MNLASNSVNVPCKGSGRDLKLAVSSRPECFFKGPTNPKSVHGNVWEETGYIVAYATKAAVGTSRHANTVIDTF